MRDLPLYVDSLLTQSQQSGLQRVQRNVWRYLQEELREPPQKVRAVFEVHLSATVRVGLPVADDYKCLGLEAHAILTQADAIAASVRQAVPEATQVVPRYRHGRLVVLVRLCFSNCYGAFLMRS